MTEKVNSPRGAARGKERPQGLSGGVGGDAGKFKTQAKLPFALRATSLGVSPHR